MNPAGEPSMKRPLACLLGLALLALPGCVYAHIKSPLDEDLQVTKLGNKVGTASNHQILGLVAWGDASTQAAAKDGGITTLNHADEEWMSILWFVYGRQTTIVYGD
ncbi:MAG: hypothetical protein FJ293_01930 [Planctomycetes bacterium]|nr:hypothetical protein [Planctomycetota bacterium]